MCGLVRPSVVKRTVTSGLAVMESADEIEDYEGTLVVKKDRKERRAPSPVDMNKLPPIQVPTFTLLNQRFIPPSN